MKIAPPSATPPVATTLKTNTQNELNPAKQAKAAETPAKGSAFGHAVAEFAHARNAARFEAKHGPKAPAPPVLPPVVETPPVEDTPPTEETPPVGDAPPVEDTTPVEETTPPVAETDPAPVVDPAASVETQLLASLVANIDAEPGDALDILA